LSETWTFNMAGALCRNDPGGGCLSLTCHAL